VNADSPAAITDCLEAARDCNAPIIIETSLWQLTGRSFGAGDPILGLARYLADLSVLANSDRYRHLPVVYHTDHIKGPATREILTAAIRGVPVAIGETGVALHASSVSLDSSSFSVEENIRFACDLCRIARQSERPLTLEVEAGVDDGLTPLTVTEQILGEIEADSPNNIALWAPGLGTRHGYSAEGYPAFSAEAVAQQREMARQLTGRKIGIALHGSSGLADDLLQNAVRAGVVKVNCSTESLRVRSQAARDFYRTRSAHLEPDHATFKATAMDNALQTYVSERYLPVIRDRIRLLGGGNKAMNFTALIPGDTLGRAGRS
jgi:fructose-bisphosphate aldolase, class II